MQGLNVVERIGDISEISGLSQEIVRRVLNAERESMIKSLKKGERVTLIGRCVIRPEMRLRLGVADISEELALTNSVKLTASVVPSLASELANLTSFEKDEASIEAYIGEDFKIMTRQIEALE